MDCYLDLKRPASNEPVSSPSCTCKKPKSCAKQGDVSAAYRAQEFDSNFYESGGKLFCKPCNVVVNHVRKSVVTLDTLFNRERRRATFNLQSKHKINGLLPRPETSCF